MSRFVLVLSLILSFISGFFGNNTFAKGIDGYPLANFAVTANASADGSFVGDVLRNPGKLGPWLEDMGSVEFLIRRDGKEYSLSDIDSHEVERLFPFVHGVYSGTPLGSAVLDATLFCPIGINDIATSSLPAVQIALDFTSGDKAEDFDLIIRPSRKDLSAVSAPSYSGAGNDGMLVVVDSNDASWTDDELVQHISLKPGETKSIRPLLVYYDPDWITANDYASGQEIAEHVYSVWNDLKARTEAFSAAIPTTGDEEIDTYLRWYMIPAVSLTRYTRNGEVLNMGYCELNQRDSYMTSWLHLVLFKDLDRKMIEESLASVSDAGKVPTTILPLIEREDDLDINAFLLMRIARYYKLYHNKGDLERWWPTMKRVMDWLISRDTNGNGLPMQISFWGDWKDVAGINGRLYSPFSGLIYMAALKNMQAMAKDCDDTAAADKYAQAYKKADEFINKPVEQGGLWNGDYYCQIWRDGSVNDKLLQDQTIGLMFGVVPPDRCESIINALNKNNFTQWGICETYPYYPDEFGYERGTYHNGGVWPWVSFMDDWGRVLNGRRNEAINLIKTVAKADLVDSGDWAPNEHINSRTGQNLGFKLQGWNSALFGLVYFGLLHPEITPWY